MADEVVLDFESLSIGDIEDMEEYVGQPMMVIAAQFEKAKENLAALLTGKWMTVAVWLIERNTNPRYTLAEARRRTLGEAMALLKTLSPNPSAPGDGGAPTPAS